MKQEKLQEIRERVNKASRNEKWFVENGSSIFVTWYNGRDVQLAQTIRPVWHEDRFKGDEEAYANAEFIAHAREDVPNLLDEVERLREVLKWYAAEDLTTIGDVARRALEG